MQKPTLCTWSFSFIVFAPPPIWQNFKKQLACIHSLQSIQPSFPENSWPGRIVRVCVIANRIGDCIKACEAYTGCEHTLCGSTAAAWSRLRAPGSHGGLPGRERPWGVGICECASYQGSLFGQVKWLPEGCLRRVATRIIVSRAFTVCLALY